MGRLIVWNLVSVDGCFEGAAPWDLDFHNLVWGEELEALSIDQLDGADALLFGRATYEGMAAYWQNATDEGEVAKRMNAIRKVVVTASLSEALWHNTTIVRNAAGVARLKQEVGRNIYIFGSAQLIDSLRPEQLIDEYRLCVAPVLLGRGTPHFKLHQDGSQLELLESKQLSSGAVIMRYRPIPAA